MPTPEGCPHVRQTYDRPILEDNMTTISARHFVERAKTGGYLGIPYSDLDCQALMELVLKDCGVSKDWRGSNDMWRSALSEKHEIVDKNNIPAGAWLFTVKTDGGEKERGYYDNEGNAAHVGIYLGNGDVMHSTAGGVQMDTITSKRWTHYGLCKYIDYTNAPISISDQDIIDRLKAMTLYDLWKLLKKWG